MGSAICRIVRFHASISVKSAFRQDVCAERGPAAGCGQLLAVGQRPAKPVPKWEPSASTRKKSSATPAGTSFMPRARAVPSATGSTKWTPRAAARQADRRDQRWGRGPADSKKTASRCSPEEEQAEIDRLNHLLAHPEVQEHRHKKEQEDSARGDEMVSMLPDAFLFTLTAWWKAPTDPATA